MGRKNKRKKAEYPERLGFNPWKYIHSNPSDSAASSDSVALKADWESRNKSPRVPQRGDIWFAVLSPHAGTSVQGGCRPVLIVSNDVGNNYAETLNVLPMTRHLKKPNLPCHTVLDPDIVSEKRQTLDTSMILAEQITTISKSELRNYVGCVKDEELLSEINRAVAGQLGLVSIGRRNTGKGAAVI